MAEELVSRTYVLPRDVVVRIGRLCRATGRTAAAIVAEAASAYYEQVKRDAVLGPALSTLEHVEATYGQPVLPRRRQRKAAGGTAPSANGG